jgi:hypothetical protein
VRRTFANLLEYCNPYSTMQAAAAANLTSSPSSQDEDTPAAKRPRLQTSTSSSQAVDADTVVDTNAIETVTAASSDDTVGVAPADAVTVVASLPRSRASRLPIRRRWKPEEDSMLIEAVKKFGNDWVRVAKLLPGRTNRHCREIWVKYLPFRLSSERT